MKYRVLAASFAAMFAGAAHAQSSVTRTDLFTVGIWQHAFAGAKVTGNFNAVTPYSQSPTLPNGVGASSTQTQTVLQPGVRHVF